MKDNTDFAQWLIGHRNKYNVTQKEIARLLEVSPPRISEWERKVRTPKPLTQLGIKSILTSRHFFIKIKRK
jgi:transcriptional regulator with XRE-family HTH domain